LIREGRRKPYHSEQQSHESGKGKNTQKRMQMPIKKLDEISRLTRITELITWQRRQKKPLAVET